MRLGLLGAFAVGFFLVLAPAAQAEKRVALVIGNNAYENVPPLQKAVNDADAVSRELAKLGFEVVRAQDVGRRAMSRALVELEGKVGAGDTALVYFAGHGFAVDGTNCPWMCRRQRPGKGVSSRMPPSRPAGCRTACRRRAPAR